MANVCRHKCTCIRSTPELLASLENTNFTVFTVIGLPFFHSPAHNLDVTKIAWLRNPAGELVLMLAITTFISSKMRGSIIFWRALGSFKFLSQQIGRLYGLVNGMASTNIITYRCPDHGKVVYEIRHDSDH